MFCFNYANPGAPIGENCMPDEGPCTRQGVMKMLNKYEYDCRDTLIGTNTSGSILRKLPDEDLGVAYP
jgi:hypothetical protein